MYGTEAVFNLLSVFFFFLVDQVSLALLKTKATCMVVVDQGTEI